VGATVRTPSAVKRRSLTIVPLTEQDHSHLVDRLNSQCRSFS